jgi:hypothetical protein
VLSAAFHHEDGNHGVEHCDDHEDECLEVVVGLVWHLDGLIVGLVAEGLW